MKNKEEIEHLADKIYGEYSGYHKVSFVKGYTQCQEDMDKKYTEKDMITFAFDTYYYISGIMGVPFNQVSKNRTHAEYNFKNYINSLNKQD